MGHKGPENPPVQQKFPGPAAPMKIDEKKDRQDGRPQGDQYKQQVEGEGKE